MNEVPPTSPTAILRYGVVAVVMREERFLVIRRSALVRAPGKYCFPGGGIEAGESELAALIREVQEELGVAIHPLRRIWRSTTPWGIDLAWWLGELDEQAILAANPAEVESIHWLTQAEMLALEELLESNRHFLAEVASGQISLATDGREPG